MEKLIKPQFEAGREKVGKKGIIRDKVVHEEVILDIYEFCSSIDLFVKDMTYSPIKGGGGNIEYLFYITKGNNDEKGVTQNVVKELVNESHNAL